MSTIPATNPTGSSSNSGSSNPKDLNNIDVSQFLQLMITQLQHQDPLNPESNAQLMQQVGEIQQISSTNKLSTTLNSVALGQTLSSATTLIGKHITGLDDSGNAVDGLVQKISVLNNQPKLYVGDQIVSISNVKEILPAS